MATPTIIGISGRAGAGKDHLYRALVDAYHDFPSTAGRLPVRLAFADALRQEVANVIVQPEVAEISPKATKLWDKPTSPEIRALLQWYGQWRREQQPLYWVHKLWPAVVEQYGRGRLPVITDVRHVNEADAIRNAGGIVVRVVANSQLRMERLGGTLPPDHLSESALDDYDFDVVILSEGRDDYYRPQVQDLWGLITRGTEMTPTTNLDSDFEIATAEELVEQYASGGEFLPNVPLPFDEGPTDADATAVIDTGIVDANGSSVLAHRIRVSLGVFDGRVEEFYAIEWITGEKFFYIYEPNKITAIPLDLISRIEMPNFNDYATSEGTTFGGRRTDA